MERFFKYLFRFVWLVRSLALFVAGVTLILYFSYIFGHRLLEEGMLGGDSAYHLAWIHTLNRYYPKVPMWFPFAGGGQSIVLGYWVLPYYLTIVVSSFSKLTIEQAFRILEFLSVPVICLEIYVYIWVRLKNQVMATIGSLLYLLSSVSWGFIASAGFFAMQLSIATLLPAFLFFDLYLEEELNPSQKVVRKRLFLLGFCVTLTLAILMHGSAMPTIFLGLPFYTLLRSQLNPRRSENRLLSFLRAVKALTFCLIFGIGVSSFFFFPQMRYFSFQAGGQGFGYGADIPSLPWRGFLGFERLNPLDIGSLHEPLFISLLVTSFGLIGIVFALFRRNFLLGLGVTAFFYVWWISSTPLLQKTFPSLSIFLNPTNVRSVNIPAIYLTILAAYGFWSLADLPGVILRFLGKLLGKVKFIGKIFEPALKGISFLISSILVILLFILAFYNFRSRQAYPTKIFTNERVPDGVVSREYPGFGTAILSLDIPFCMFPRWEKEVSPERCEMLKPKFFTTGKLEVGIKGRDLIGSDFDKDVAGLDLGKLTRVSISPSLGSFAFSFADHAQASMVQTPSSQATPIINWLGLHNGTLFIREDEPSQEEVSEVAKWFGVRYVFLSSDRDKEVLNRYPENFWPVVVKTRGSGEEVQVRELRNSPGMVTFSSRQAILVIGSEDKRAYTDVYKIVTKGGFSFDKALLVYGSSNIDDYSLEELKNFSVVVLHGYSYRNYQKAWDRLKKFVNDGGSLFVDTGWQYVAKDWGKGRGETEDFLEISLPEPIPVSKTLWGNIGKGWDGVSLDTEIGKDLDVRSFGPLTWGNDPWGMALAKGSNLRSWARPVISTGDKVIIASGNFGKGRVVWSGMNLFAHSLSGQSAEEQRLIKNIFDFLLLKEEIDEGKLLVNWEFPDRIEFSFPKVPAKPSFLYLADSYTPDWKAYLVKNGRRKDLKVYRAGPGFKAVRLEGLNGNEKLIFEYSLKRIFFVSFGITFITFLILLVSIFDSLFFRRILERKILKRLIGKESFTLEDLRKSVKKRLLNSLSWMYEEE